MSCLFGRYFSLTLDETLDEQLENREALSKAATRDVLCKKVFLEISQN